MIRLHGFTLEFLFTLKVRFEVRENSVHNYVFIYLFIFIVCNHRKIINAALSLA